LDVNEPVVVYTTNNLAEIEGADGSLRVTNYSGRRSAARSKQSKRRGGIHPQRLLRSG
jgi:hypothetical protein